MNVEDFVAEALLSVLRGVGAAKERALNAITQAKERIGRVDPPIGIEEIGLPSSPGARKVEGNIFGDHLVRDVEFEIAVKVADEATRTAAGELRAAVLEVAARGSGSSSEETLHRIKFSVPVTFSSR